MRDETDAQILRELEETT